MLMLMLIGTDARSASLHTGHSRLSLVQCFYNLVSGNLVWVFPYWGIFLEIGIVGRAERGQPHWALTGRLD